MSKGTIFSGMRPTGRLHVGHLSVLENWVKLQNEYECYFGIVDWHAMTTSFEETESFQDNIREMAIDWLSVGLDPEKSAIFIQSHVKEHAELHLAFSMITPISWLERVPAYKDQIQQLGLQGKDINTYGFLGYPLLMAADILIYKADTVPVGVDQLPHLELAREVARRFNFMYNTDLFPEPQAKLAEVTLLPGVDGRKMSKSYKNYLSIAASSEEIKQAVNAMITDPARVRKTDPGNPEVCVVHTYQKLYNLAEVEEIHTGCRQASMGCVACKQRLAASIEKSLAPYRDRRAALEAKPQLVDEILHEGARKAQVTAKATMQEVKEAIRFK